MSGYRRDAPQPLKARVHLVEVRGLTKCGVYYTSEALDRMATWGVYVTTERQFVTCQACNPELRPNMPTEVERAETARRRRENRSEREVRRMANHRARIKAMHAAARKEIPRPVERGEAGERD